MWVKARLWPTVRVARVLGRFPRLTRPGQDRAGGCRFGGCWGILKEGLCSPVRCIGVRAIDCAPGEQGCAGRGDGV
ncbi:hypothetical protein HMPREF0970_01886 [Schaalia odontolytica F0309]|uniref:Uncharacterized protein n=1 Tax=Schaalia odontolytica F0309 TaxID=649742 RepID=D4U0Z2_9ACTO|nr:hypothetical protein HMPREF0970_01886 [Schaalia odontolytica F0309]